MINAIKKISQSAALKQTTKYELEGYQESC